jgi:hypothetical protein
MQNKNYTRIVTPPARLLFPALFEPKSFQDGGQAKYGAVLVFPAGTDLTSLKALIKDEYAASFPSRPQIQNPLRNGDDKVDEWGEVFRGATFLRVSTTKKPTVFDANCQPVMDSSAVFNGAVCRAEVHAFAYDKMGNRGISVTLDSIQILPGGARLSDTGEASRRAFASTEPKMLDATAYQVGGEVPAAAQGSAQEDAQEDDGWL